MWSSRGAGAGPAACTSLQPITDAVAEVDGLPPTWEGGLELGVVDSLGDGEGLELQAATRTSSAAKVGTSRREVTMPQYPMPGEGHGAADGVGTRGRPGVRLSPGDLTEIRRRIRLVGDEFAARADPDGEPIGILAVVHRRRS